MTQVLSLLIMAVQLLTAAQNSPNLTPEFRQTAINLANYSISVAQEAIQNQTPEIVPQNIPVIPQQIVYVQPPVVGSPIINQPTIQVEKNIELEMVYMKDVERNVYYNSRLYYTENGVKISGVQVDFTADKGVFNIEGERKFTGKTRAGVANDGGAGLPFQYLPQENGTRTITFTANGFTLTKEVKGND